MLQSKAWKKIALVLLIAAIGAAGGAGVAYHFAKSTGKVPNKDLARLNAPTSIAPDKSKANTQVPVATIAKDFKNYVGLKVTVLGKVEKTNGSPAHYILVSDDGKASLLIDTSALNGQENTYLGKQVKVAGTIKFLDNGNGHFTLGIQATSIST